MHLKFQPNVYMYAGVYAYVCRHLNKELETSEGVIERKISIPILFQLWSCIMTCPPWPTMSRTPPQIAKTFGLTSIKHRFNTFMSESVRLSVIDLDPSIFAIWVLTGHNWYCSCLLYHTRPCAYQWYRVCACNTWNAEAKGQVTEMHRLKVKKSWQHMWPNFVYPNTWYHSGATLATTWCNYCDHFLTIGHR